jgi:hypothetical protein
VSAPSYQVTVFTAEETAGGQLAFETFIDAMAAWMPRPPQWNTLSTHVQNGWIAVAKRLRPVS